ncbi:hypothetical protein CAOG_05062 [Capsaspora owczarzaki ATCC 30864]|uniref:hypothetical protein n=1 Tax=Capsaspora owczarzaki (strain ATCC 30864) TaxID=595528 RepID=UPI0003521DE4|nr:hypothetical protein CAOG_05062 [Capsaspora owczarzaki ATCC 30864]|eukprot:XP_004346747.2 hypothetical protein CAOG_05062 [Capsaspora owczarzaki ATCC 30864]
MTMMANHTSTAEIIARVRLQLSDQSPRTLYGVTPQLEQLEKLMRRTVANLESNSALLIGPRGSGKSAAVNACIAAITADFGSDAFAVVRLNGLIHTDDRLALRDIASQLKVQRALETGNLSSFAAALAFILETLRNGSRQSQPLIVILDEFDQFAHHAKQTLLYNLFDLVQSAEAPMIVLGLSCRLDVIELLEKRVKSRFSHRQIHFLHNFGFDEYLSIARNSLLIAGAEHDAAISAWNAQVAEAMNDRSLVAALQVQFDLSKDPRVISTVLSSALTASATGRLQASSVVSIIQAQFVDAKALVLQGLSTLELCLMIAINHVQVKVGVLEPFNFEMVYEEYKAFANSNVHVIDFFSKPVSLKAFEHLQAIELIKPVHPNAFHVPKEYRMMRMMVEPAQIVDAVTRFQDCSTAVRRWGSQWAE